MRMKVLIVDDHAVLGNILERDLREAGYTGDVIHARSAREAFDMYITERPDAIITDYMMPSDHGIDLAIWIREYGDSKIPICLTTGYDITGGKLWPQYCNRFILKSSANAQEYLDFLRKAESVVA